MSKIIDPEKYDAMLSDDRFINDLFTSMGATDRLMTLFQAGFDLEAEYAEYQKQYEEPTHD